jgi:hypothetical protein
MHGKASMTSSNKATGSQKPFFLTMLVHNLMKFLIMGWLVALPVMVSAQKQFSDDKLYSGPESLGKFQVSIPELIKAIRLTAQREDNKEVTLVYSDQKRIEMQGIFCMSDTWYGIRHKARCAVKVRLELKPVAGSECIEVTVRSIVLKRSTFSGKWKLMDDTSAYYDVVRKRLINVVFNFALNTIDYTPC